MQHVMEGEKNRNPVATANTLGTEGGLFTRSGSAAHPYLVEQLTAISKPKNNLWNGP
jgi:hypothetical protein